MQSIIKLPDNLQKIRDNIIENITSKSFSIDDLIELQKWLEEDGWDDLVAPFRLDELALNLNEWDVENYSEYSLREYEGLDDSEVVSDEMRINFARKRIQDEIENGDGLTNPSVISYEIKNDDEKSVILGCTVEIHGQLGPEVKWHGVFISKEAFYEHLRNNRFILQSEIEHMSDSKILELWKNK